MENLINRILKIDEDARKRLESAKESKAQTIVSAERQEEEIRTEVLKRADGRLEKVEEFEKQNADEKIAVIDADKQSKISELDKAYRSKHKKWENEIFNNIISVD